MTKREMMKRICGRWIKDVAPTVPRNRGRKAVGFEGYKIIYINIKYYVYIGDLVILVSILVIDRLELLLLLY